MTVTFAFELVHRVPVVEKDGARWMVDTGCPYSYPRLTLKLSTQQFHGIPGLRVMGLDMLRRYVKIDYASQTIVTSDEPIALDGAIVQFRTDSLERWLVPMSVGDETREFYVDTGAAYSYVWNLSPQFPYVDTVQDNGFSGNTWLADVRKVPCSFSGHPFDILCANAPENQEHPNGAAVPEEGVIGYEFFNNFTLVADRLGRTMTFAKY